MNVQERIRTALDAIDPTEVRFISLYDGDVLVVQVVADYFRPYHLVERIKICISLVDGECEEVFEEVGLRFECYTPDRWAQIPHGAREIAEEDLP